ncbi:hypothetical protein AgCh_035629 [Apium graveolens]
MIATIIQQSVILPSFDKACSMLELDHTILRKIRREIRALHPQSLLHLGKAIMSNNQQERQYQRGGHWGRGGGRFNREKGETAAVVHVGMELVGQTNISNDFMPDDNWYMDTGASFHVMNNPGSSNGGNIDEVH